MIFTPAANYLGTANIAYTAADSDGDQSSSTFAVSVVPPGTITPVSGGGNVALLVDEAGLPGGTSAGNGSDVATGTLAFTAGSVAANTFAFATDLSSLNGNTDLDPTIELVWVRVDDTHIEARYDSVNGSPAVELTLTPPAGGDHRRVRECHGDRAIARQFHQ